MAEFENLQLDFFEVAPEIDPKIQNCPDYFQPPSCSRCCQHSYRSGNDSRYAKAAS